MKASAVSIHVVDDDESVREAVGSLIRSAGWRVETFASAQEFLSTFTKEYPQLFSLGRGSSRIKRVELQAELAKLNGVIGSADGDPAESGKEDY